MLPMYGLHPRHDAQKNSSRSCPFNFAYCSHFCRFRANRSSNRTLVLRRSNYGSPTSRHLQLFDPPTALQQRLPVQLR